MLPPPLHLSEIFLEWYANVTRAKEESLLYRESLREAKWIDCCNHALKWGCHENISEHGHVGLGRTLWSCVGGGGISVFEYLAGLRANPLIIESPDCGVSLRAFERKISSHINRVCPVKQSCRSSVMLH